ncbi:hypothetical protein, variant [Verruconis gallopava]|uniref:A-kinase anchor protein 7-like phosphoesterase domain-containing protein n=1 Tax=Verruconis gallopava TaxID=253628 RepID=A0A0D2B4T7_9PEZI|nr:hypothetical protein, variant [Verruconis gallopava]KIW06254.1 hypothetical protein, variant [Verruconis gallopava]
MPSWPAKEATHKRPPLTHFVCIPLVTDVTRPQLDASLSRFRDLLAENNKGVDGPASAQTFVPVKAVRPVGTIHFTLGVMSLTSVDRVSEAIGFLQSLDLRQLMQEVLLERKSDNGVAPWPLKISLTSLHSMHPPENTSILYAGPQDANDVLSPFCAKLSQMFRSAGFTSDDRPLKLHATILNTIYAKAGGRGRQPVPAGPRGESSSQATSALRRPQDANDAKSTMAGEGGSAQDDSGSERQGRDQDTSRGHGPNARAPIRLDATSLLEECKEIVWASDFTLEKIALCKMGAKKVFGDDGEVVDEEYEEVASVPLPL